MDKWHYSEYMQVNFRKIHFHIWSVSIPIRRSQKVGIFIILLSVYSDRSVSKVVLSQNGYCGISPYNVDRNCVIRKKSGFPNLCEQMAFLTIANFFLVIYVSLCKLSCFCHKTALQVDLRPLSISVSVLLSKPP